MNKHIKEMAKVLRKGAICYNCRSSINGNERRDWDCHRPRNLGCRHDDDILKACEALYNAGYRKQREGYWYKHDKKKHGDTCYYCSACEGMALADCMSWELTDYCPKCGAKMKGDKTDA